MKSAVTLVSTSITALLSIGVLWKGINIGPDGWAFWQGAVSMMEGQGYAYFFHQLPIEAWPPVYSWYLLAWQSVFGVSGATLIASTVFLSAVAALGWTLFVLALLERSVTPRRLVPWLRWLLPGFAAAFIVYYFKGVGIDTLRFTVLPFFLLALLASLAERRLPDRWETVALVLLGLLQALIHNASLVFVLATGLVYANRFRSARGLASAVLLAGVPIAGWLAFRYAFGLEHSHVFRFALDPARLVETLGKTYADTVNLLFGPDRSSTSLFGILAVFTTTLTFRLPAGDAAAPSTRWKGARNGLALFTLLALLLNIVFCHVTQLLTVTRYIWFVPLIGVPLLLLTAAAQKSRWKFHATIGLLLLPAVVKTVLLLGATAMDWKGYVSSKPRDRFITPEMYIDIRHPDVNAQRTEKGVLVSPPVYEWIERRAKAGEE